MFVIIIKKWNEDKCRCECLVNKKYDNDFVWNISNCKFEYRKKAAKLTTEEECEEIDDISTTDDDISYIKTILVKESVENYKPSVALFILFLLVLIIIIGPLIYFYVKSRPKNYLPY